MKILIKIPTSQSYQTINISSEDTVKQLKEYIEHSQHIKAADQFLTFGCKPLSDTFILDSYGIQEWSTIQLNVRLRGGSDGQVHPKGGELGHTDRFYLQDNQSVSSDGTSQEACQTPGISIKGSEDIEELKRIFLEGSKERVKRTNAQFESIGDHESAVSAVAVSGSSRYVASASDVGVIKVFDIITRKEMPDLNLSHQDTVRAIAFSRDDKYIISCCDEQVIKAFDFELKKPAFELKNAHEARIMCLALSRDNKYLVSGSNDKSIKLWDLTTQQQLHHFKNCHTDQVNSVAISSDNKYIVSGSLDGSIKKFSVETRQEVSVIERAHKSQISSIALSSDSKHIASGGWDKSIKIFDFETNELVHEFKNAHKQWVTTLVMSDDNKYLVSGSRDNHIKAFDIETKHQIQAFQQAHNGPIHTVAISNNGRYIITGGEDKAVRVFELEIQNQIRHFKEAHQAFVSCVAVTKNNKYVVSGSWDKDIKIFDIAQDREVHVFKDAHKEHVTAITVSDDNRYIISGSFDKSIKVFDMITHQEVFHLEKIHTSIVESVAISRNQQYIVSGSSDYSIKIIDFATKKVVHSFNETHKNSVMSVKISDDNKYIVSASHDRSIKVFDVQTRREIRHLLNVHTGGIHSMVLTKKYIISSSEDKSIKMFDLETGQLVHYYNDVHTRPILCLSISRDEKYLISSSADKSIKIFDLETKQQLCHFENAHTNAIPAVSISSDNKYIVSASFDKSVKVFNFPYYDKTWIFPRSSKIPAYSLIGAYENFILNAPDDSTRAYNIEAYHDLYFLPYNWTVLHLLAIFEPQHTYTFASYANLKVPFLVDRLNRTPLHYLFSHTNIDYSSVNTTFKYILDFLDDKTRTPYDLIVTMDSLSSIFSEIITNASPSLVKRFLKYAYNDVYTTHGDEIPRFGQADSKNCLSRSLALTPDTKKALYEKGQNRITFQALKLHLDYNPTSDDMLKTATTLSGVNNEEIFSTKAVSSIVEHLWKSGRRFHLASALLFSVLMILFSVYVGLGERTLGLEVSILIISCFFMVCKILQAYKLRMKYLSSVWNLGDTVFFGLMIATIGTRISNNEDELARSWLYSVVIIIGYLRWMSYLRLFDASRVLIEVIMTVLKDMWGFCLVIFFIIIGFSLIFLEFDRGTEYKDHLYATYNILYGSSDYSSFSPSQLILLAIILFFLNVVLLNMLITIMGGSFSNVMEQRVLTDSLTKLELIIESMALLRLFKKSNAGEKGYILFCEPKEVEDVDESGDGQLAEKIEALQEMFKGNNSQIEKLGQDMRALEKTMSENYVSMMSAIKALSEKK